MEELEVGVIIGMSFVITICLLISGLGTETYDYRTLNAVCEYIMNDTNANIYIDWEVYTFKCELNGTIDVIKFNTRKEPVINYHEKIIYEHKDGD